MQTLSLYIFFRLSTFPRNFVECEAKIVRVLYDLKYWFLSRFLVVDQEPKGKESSFHLQWELWGFFLINSKFKGIEVEA